MRVYCDIQINIAVVTIIAGWKWLQQIYEGLSIWTSPANNSLSSVQKKQIRVDTPNQGFW